LNATLAASQRTILCTPHPASHPRTQDPEQAGPKPQNETPGAFPPEPQDNPQAAQRHTAQDPRTQPTPQGEDQTQKPHTTQHRTNPRAPMKPRQRS
jgi:hypothetical protein